MEVFWSKFCILKVFCFLLVNLEVFNNSVHWYSGTEKHSWWSTWYLFFVTLLLRCYFAYLVIDGIFTASFLQCITSRFFSFGENEFDGFNFWEVYDFIWTVLYFWQRMVSHSARGHRCKLVLVHLLGSWWIVWQSFLEVFFVDEW